MNQSMLLERSCLRCSVVTQITLVRLVLRVPHFMFSKAALIYTGIITHVTPVGKGETITGVNSNVLFFANKRLQNFYMCKHGKQSSHTIAQLSIYALGMHYNKRW